MKADLTRNTFDPFKHFSRVLMQQGRVQVDADWNEQSAILLRLVRRLAAAVIGPAGSPDNGFSIAPLGSSQDDFVIAAGTYYVDGILCEAEATPVQILAFGNSTITVGAWTADGVAFAKGQALQISDDGQVPPKVLGTANVMQVNYATMTVTLDADFSTTVATLPRARRLLTYTSQPDLAQPPPELVGGQVYLDVWERLVTCLEDDSIREVAFNGPDTAARTRVVWQVKVLASDAEPCMTPQQLSDAFQPANRGLLRARTQPAPGATDPCTVSPDSRYRGPENQLYRVEINTGSGDASVPATFKWSRENGSVVFPIASLSPGSGTTTAMLCSMGRDDRFGLAEGDYVEVQDDDSVLANAAGQLLQVQAIDAANRMVTLAGTPGSTVGTDPTRHPLLRRWDQKAGDPAQGGLQLGADGAGLIPRDNVTLPGDDSDWLNLEDGVQVQFWNVDQSTFGTGDYWLIPARVATGDVQWPTETVTTPQGGTLTNPVAKPPDGVTHHYAPLAVIAVSADRGVSVARRCRLAITPPVEPAST